jgi:hypothetical protein
VGFLSTVDRLSPGDAQRVSRLAKRAVVGNGVATMSRSEATKVHPPLPTVVHAELGAGLTLSLAELPAAAVSTFKHAVSMANPKFYELQRLRSQHGKLLGLSAATTSPSMNTLSYLGGSGTRSCRSSSGPVRGSRSWTCGRRCVWPFA